MKARTWLAWAVTVGVVGVVQPFILTGAVIAAGGAAGAIGAAKVGAVGLGAAKVGVVGLGAAKVGAVGLGAAKVGAVGVGVAGKVGFAKVGLGTVVVNGFNAGLRTGLYRDSSNERYSRGHGSGSYGPSRYHRSHGSSRYRRFRREVGGYTNAQEMLLSNAYAMDQEKPCGLRLVCELATKGADRLHPDELAIMALLHQPHALNSMVTPYSQAAHLGRTASVTVCAETFQRCPLDHHEIMQVLRQHTGA